MKLALKFLFLFYFFIQSFSSIKSNVLEITDDNFMENVHDNVLMLIFYIPECTISQAARKEYAIAAKKMEEVGVKFGEVDVSVQKTLESRFNIESYPTFLLIRNTFEIPYSGKGHDSTELVNWIQKKLQSYVTKLEDTEHMEEFLKENEEGISVIFFGDRESEILLEMNEVAFTLKNLVKFASINNYDAAMKFNAGIDDILLFRSFDEKIVKFNHLIEKLEENIEEFVLEKSVPSVAKFNELTGVMVFSSTPKSAIFLYRDSIYTNEYENIFYDIVDEYKNQLKFVISDIRESNPYEKALKENLYIQEEDLPCIWIYKITDTEVMKYPLKKSINTLNVIEFINEYLEDKLEPVLISEDENQDEVEEITRIKKVVGMTYRKIVQDPEKDVLLIWFSPTCPYSKEALENLEKIANLLKNNNDLIIARIDATRNEVPNEEVYQFPTIRFYSHKNKTPVEFNDVYTEISILKQLSNQNLKTPLSEIQLEIIRNYDDANTDEQVETEKRDL